MLHFYTLSNLKIRHDVIVYLRWVMVYGIVQSVYCGQLTIYTIWPTQSSSILQLRWPYSGKLNIPINCRKVMMITMAFISILSHCYGWVYQYQEKCFQCKNYNTHHHKDSTNYICHLFIILQSCTTETFHTIPLILISVLWMGHKFSSTWELDDWWLDLCHHYVMSMNSSPITPLIDCPVSIGYKNNKINDTLCQHLLIYQ